ncbi:MAG: DUF1501 domain-containing protein [Phycisphaerales bacterium]|nr:DUF1501 domain-containing protein [Phycisphaerales bacterium]
MKMTRREFVTRSVGGATLIASGATLPGFLTRTALAASPDRDGRILVVIQLTGGNDGLNTVVPYRDDLYHRARPTLRVTDQLALPLEMDMGLHPDMSGFKRLFDDGLLSVINNVGYPNPNRSHFQSMDIWHTASMSPETADDGWLGRVVDAKTTPGAPPYALHIDDAALPLALRTRETPTPSIRSVEAFQLADENSAVESAIAAIRQSASDDLLFVQRLAVESCRNARRIEQVANDVGASTATYPDYRLAARLRQVAQLIGAGFGPRVYYTSIDGFDTHAQQALSHGTLLRELADSVAAFVDDLRARGLLDRVAIMTFSEFGRRLNENAGQGTDHGAAAPMFLISSDARPGVHGGAPDLTNLLDDDLRHRVDFRSVYAGVLKNWLQVDHRAVLGDFAPMRGVWSA